MIIPDINDLKIDLALAWRDSISSVVPDAYIVVLDVFNDIRVYIRCCTYSTYAEYVDIRPEKDYLRVTTLNIDKWMPLHEFLDIINKHLTAKV